MLTPTEFYRKRMTCLTPNGYRLNRSVAIPTSNLARVVNYIRYMMKRHPKTHPYGFTLNELKLNALGFDSTEYTPSNQWLANTSNGGKILRSWNSTFFSAAVKGGYLKKNRRIGNSWFYELGPNADSVIRTNHPRLK